MDPVTDDDISTALAPYHQVRASEQLQAAVVRSSSTPPLPSLVRRRPRLVAAGAVAALATAGLGVIVVTAANDEPGRTDTGADTTTGADTATGVEGGGDAADRPLDLGGARMVVFADGTTVSIEELFDVANHERLQAVFAEHGAELVVNERPVAPAADGRVFAIMADVVGDQARGDTIRLDPGVRVEVEVGRADPDADTEGLTLYEVFPDIEDAIAREDPVATGQALERLGFQVRWAFIEAPGEGHDVDAPPPGTVVISVLGPNGEWTDIDPATDTLMVELALPDVAQDLGHWAPPTRYRR